MVEGNPVNSNKNPVGKFLRFAFAILVAVWRIFKSKRNPVSTRPLVASEIATGQKSSLSPECLSMRQSTEIALASELGRYFGRHFCASVSGRVALAATLRGKWL